MKFLVFFLFSVPLFSFGQRGVVLHIIDNYDLMINERKYFVPDSVFREMIDLSDLIRNPELYVGKYIHLVEIHDSLMTSMIIPECEFSIKNQKYNSTVRAFTGEYDVQLKLMTIEDYINLKPTSSVYGRQPYVGSSALLTYVVILEKIITQKCISYDRQKVLRLDKKSKKRKFKNGFKFKN